MIQFLLKKVSAFATKHSPKSHVILLDFPAWMLGKRTKIILPNGGFDGDESHGTLVLKKSPTKNKSKVMILLMIQKYGDPVTTWDLFLKPVVYHGIVDTNLNLVTLPAPG